MCLNPLSGFINEMTTVEKTVVIMRTVAPVTGAACDVPSTLVCVAWGLGGIAQQQKNVAGTALHWAVFGVVPDKVF